MCRRELRQCLLYNAKFACKDTQLGSFYIFFSPVFLCACCAACSRCMCCRSETCTHLEPSRLLSSSSIFPDGLQIEVASLLGTTDTPALPLVAAVHAETHGPGTRNVETASSDSLRTTLRRLGSSLHLSDPVCLNCSFLGVGRVLNRLQARNTWAP